MTAPGRSVSIPKPPTPLAAKLVRYILGFGVSVSIGLAPYLGKLDIPLFAPLLSLLPESIQNTAIPVSSALMGVLAVLVQWFAADKPGAAALRRWFVRTLISGLAALLLLLVLNTLVVVEVPYQGGEKIARFVVGFSRPLRTPCTPEVSDAECIKYLTFNPSLVDSFWGDRQVRLARLALILAYVAFMSCFGLLVGLLLLRKPVRSKH